MELKRILQSRRLILRPFRYSDAQAIYETWSQDSDVTRYVTWYEHNSIDDCMYYVSKVIEGYKKDDKRMEWLVCLKETGEPIGAICIFYNKQLKKWGFGNNYAKEYWHQGYASEALDTVLEFLFVELGVDCVFGEHFEENPNSGKVMMHCGMSFVSQKTITCKNVDRVSKYYEVFRFDWLLHKMQILGSIETKRLKLRGLQSFDIEYLISMFQDKDVNKYLCGTTVTERSDILRKLEEKMLRCVTDAGYMYYVVTRKKDNIPVGVISAVIDENGITGHSSYCYRKEYWGKGYATEALKAVMRNMFVNSDIWYFEASHAHPNVNSGKVMQRCGMKCLGYTQFGVIQTVKCVSGEYPLVKYEITRPEWHKIIAKKHKGVVKWVN